MAKGDRYLKVVAWSDEDKCFIGTCPQLMYGGSYGDDAQQVFAELCELVEEAIETLEEAGKPLPQPLSLQELENVLRRSARGLITPAATLRSAFSQLPRPSIECSYERHQPSRTCRRPRRDARPRRGRGAHPCGPRRPPSRGTPASCRAPWSDPPLRTGRRHVHRSRRL